MVEASQEDIASHNHALAVEESVGGFLSAAKQGFERQLGRYQDFASRTGITSPLPGADAFGMGVGLPPAFGQAALRAPAPPPSAETFIAANSQQAQLALEAHPIAAGLGATLAVAPPLLLLMLLGLRMAAGTLWSRHSLATNPRRRRVTEPHDEDRHSGPGS